MNFSDLCKKNNAIGTADRFTKDKLSIIESDLKKCLSDLDGLDFTIVVTGSYGRLEASVESDLDLFIFCENESTKKSIESKNEEIKKCISAHISKDTGDTGTFGIQAIDIFSDILKNIGGTKDTNTSLTRRMLFLLEGRAIHKKEVFEKYKKSLLNKYLESTTDSDIDKFLLNDIIRYYRTITTDFQYKVDEDGKSWGVRNIKLRFSRKLLYFAGVMSIAASVEKSLGDSRLENLSDLFEIPPLQRIVEIAGSVSNQCPESLINDAYTYYDHFLSIISDGDKRKELDEIQLKSQRLDSVLYNELSTESISFTKTLHALLESSFVKEHPIHVALIF